MARPEKSKFQGTKSDSSDKQELTGRVGEKKGKIGYSVKYIERMQRRIINTFGSLENAERSLAHSRKGLTHLKSEESANKNIEDVRREAIETFGSCEKAEHWLTRPSNVLDNQTPLACLAMPDGKARVMNLLGRIAHGLGA